MMRSRLKSVQISAECFKKGITNLQLLIILTQFRIIESPVQVLHDAGMEHQLVHSA